MTMHALFRRRSAIPPDLRQAYMDVMGYLNNLKAMDILKLDLDPTSVGLPSSSRNENQKVFTERELDGFIAGKPNTDGEGNPD